MNRPQPGDDEDDPERDLDDLERVYVDDLDHELDEELAEVVRGLLNGSIGVHQR